jgi:hypothetical protein
VTHRPRDLYRDEAAEREIWMQPGDTLVLVLSSVVWVIWWTTSMIVAPIRLATRRQERGMADDGWSSGDTQ